MRGMVGAIFLHQSRPHLIEQSLDAAAVVQGAFQYWNHGLGYVETASATFLGEGQQVVWMLLPPGAGGAIRPDAGLIDQRQGSLQGGPPSQEPVSEALLNHRINLFLLHSREYSTIVCIYYSMHTTYHRKKRPKINHPPSYPGPTAAVFPSPPAPPCSGQPAGPQNSNLL